MRKTISACLLVLFISLPCFSQKKKMSLFFFGGAHSVMRYGAEDDYSPGENDFPVTPAHAPMTFGLSLAHRLSGFLSLELDGRFVSASRVSLTDPSDGDTVSVDTLKHLTATLNVLFFLGRGTLQPYLVAGGGADILIGAKEQRMTTELGYEVTFLPPERTTEPAAVAGLGVVYALGSAFGLRADIRYVLLPKNASHPSIHSVSAVMGLMLRIF